MPYVTSKLGVLPLQLLVLASLVVAHPGLGRLSVVCLEWCLVVRTDNLCNNKVCECRLDKNYFFAEFLFVKTVLVEKLF